MRIELAAAIEFFKQANFVAQAGRLLELQFLGRLLHLSFQLGQQPTLPPSRKRISRSMSLRYSSLLIRRLHGAVHCLMLRQQARPEPPPPLVAVVDVEAARAELENPLQDLDRPAEAPALANGP